ncbi:MAG: RelA/SpoT family protein [bacterium]|nr:RelA/SpoT family protein [bacterium]
MNTIVEEIKKRAEPSYWPKIEKAINFAIQAHKGQKRLTGEDYVRHPLRTALILSEFRFGPKTLSAAILHDVYEDTPITLETIEKNFGKDIRFLIEGVSNLSKLKYRGTERHVENLRKLFIVMAQDIRIILIKLADRLDNLNTLYALEPERAKRIAMETLEIYAPIAHRLGMGDLKGKLEDAAFAFAFPKEFEWIQNNFKDEYEEGKKYLERIKPSVKKELVKNGVIPLEIHARPKRYYSLYKKLQKYQMDITKIYDLVALRVVVKDIEQCYLTMAIVHKLWKPMIGRIKDYIALPKPNGYRSLHTTVFCVDGRITEFQIRTKQMHDEAEQGIAAHWQYSEKKGLKKYIPGPIKKELGWINQLRDWQRSFKQTSPDEFLESLKIDFFKDRIFVFTPKGDIVELPEDATPIDFSYHIHSDIGDHCTGAKVNGKLVNFNTRLKNGDIVEIMTNPKNQPSRDWLKFARTGLAKNRIKKFIRSSLEKKEKSKLEVLKQFSQKFIFEKIAPQIKKTEKIEKTGKIIISGEKNISHNLAKCCKPKKRDEIIGYITKTKGISIHKKDCKNAKLLKKKWPSKLINASWN